MLHSRSHCFLIIGGTQLFFLNLIMPWFFNHEDAGRCGAVACPHEPDVESLFTWYSFEYPINLAFLPVVTFLMILHLEDSVKP